MTGTASGQHVYMVDKCNGTNLKPVQEIVDGCEVRTNILGELHSANPFFDNPKVHADLNSS